MTYTIVVSIAFAFGFLLGDRRGVKQANAILDANLRELFKVIGECRPPPDPFEDAEPPRHSVH